MGTLFGSIQSQKVDDQGSKQYIDHPGNIGQSKKCACSFLDSSRRISQITYYRRWYNAEQSLFVKNLKQCRVFFRLN